jgi:hypothetical protein
MCPKFRKKGASGNASISNVPEIQGKRELAVTQASPMCPKFRKNEANSNASIPNVPEIQEK